MAAWVGRSALLLQALRRLLLVSTPGCLESFSNQRWRRLGLEAANQAVLLLPRSRLHTAGHLSMGQV